MAEAIDSLVISLGLDPKALEQGLAQVAAIMQRLDANLKQFAAGFQSSFSGAAAGSGKAVSGAGAAGAAQRKLGDEAQKAGRKGQQAMEQMAGATRRAGQAAGQAGQAYNRLGSQWGGYLKGIAMRFAAPLAGALSAGAIVGSYMKDVSQVAQMTGAYSTQMEEWIKKRAMLQRVSREDIELYRKGKLALLDFNLAMSGLSTTIMRAISPAIRAGIELLHKLSDWVRRNEPNIIRFVTVLAGVITAALIPAFVKLGVTLLANPITWIIAACMALTLVIDDLVTYINGGESAFEDLWAVFGTGPEIAEKLKAAWEALKEAGIKLWEAVKAAAEKFMSYFEGLGGDLLGFFEGVKDLITALFTGSAEDVGAAVRQIFDSLLGILKTIITGAFNLLTDALKALWDKLPELASKAFGKVKGFFKGFFGGEDGEKPGGKAGEELVIPENRGPAAALPTAQQATEAGVAPSVTNNNQKEVNFDANVQTTINVQTNADAGAIGAAAGNAARNALQGLATQSAEGGVVR